MKAKIGIMSTRTMAASVMKVLEHTELNCSVQMLEYRSMEELPALYEQYKDQFDGFCITGKMAMEIIERVRTDKGKPLQSISGRAVEYYQEFFRLVNENRKIDLSRLILDSYLWLGGDAPKSAQDFLERRFPLEKKQDDLLKDLSMEQLQQADRLIVERACKMWEKGELDLVVCRFSTAYQKLWERKIPCRLIQPDPDNIQDTLERLLQQIRLERLNDSLPAVIYLSSPVLREDTFLEVNADSVGLQKCLLEFDQEQTAGFLIKKAVCGFEIYTTQKVVRRITENFTVCLLGRYLFSKLGQRVNIGYGVGYDILKARSNAMEACEMAGKDGKSYAITHKGLRVGPLDPGDGQGVLKELPQKALSAAEQSGLSVPTIQRILSASELVGSSEFTTQELANALQVTVANANRFLNALVKSGYASVVSEKKSVTKGRPSRVYRLEF